MKFKAHETFFIRKGWLYKGLKNVSKDPIFFSNKDINQTDILGIGVNMVKSLRYWLQAVGLTEEKRDGNQRYQDITRFGEIVMENDKYMEEDGTLWYLHYKLASNKKLATSWYWLFNEFNIKEFTKEDFISSLDGYVKYHEENDPVAISSLESDFSCILNTYISKHILNDEKIDPENNIDCPLGSLDLLRISDKKNKIIKKETLKRNGIHPLILLAIILEQCSEGKNKHQNNEIKITSLLSKPCNIGKIFNMDANILNYYLSQLESMNYIKVIRTAGLDVIKINVNYSWDELLIKYYKEINSFGLRGEYEQGY